MTGVADSDRFVRESDFREIEEKLHYADEALAACRSEAGGKIRKLEGELLRSRAHSDDLFKELIAMERKLSCK